MSFSTFSRRNSTNNFCPILDRLFTVKCSLFSSKPLANNFGIACEFQVWPGCCVGIAITPHIAQLLSYKQIRHILVINITKVFSEVFDKLDINKKSRVLKTNNILAVEQFGIRQWISTTALSEFINEVSWALDGSHSTMGVFCDFSRCCDCIIHDILINKLNIYNISYNSVFWIHSHIYSIVIKGQSLKKETVRSQNQVRDKLRWVCLRV